MLAFLSKFKFQAKFIGLQIFSGVFILTLALIDRIRPGRPMGRKSLSACIMATQKMTVIFSQ